LSPHVNFTEYLESSTKQYGIPMLLSEPFYRLLSPDAARHCRQVDRVRRSLLEEPLGLYTYDCDLDINWANPNRGRKRTNIRGRLQGVAQRARSKSSLHTGGARQSGVSREGEEKSVSYNERDRDRVGTKDSNRISNRESNIDESAETGTQGAAAIVDTGATVRKEGASPLRTRMDKRTTVARAKALHLPLPLVRVLSKPNFQLSKQGSTVSMGSEEEEGPAVEVSRIAPVYKLPRYNRKMWETDAELVEMRGHVTEQFADLWGPAVQAYIEGDWTQAHTLLTETLALSKQNDGPSHFLLDQIDQHGGKAPADWQGYRNDF
ncbi:hypothetical protein B484DRAFT_457553, partial [Ochromonadaceae sp. CCMP2298]